MSHDEIPIAFSCNGATLYGILSKPAQPLSRAILIVVGGPQYRAGSHRQFVLLARAFAAQGYPVLRFDYRGMGDSEGEPRNFEDAGDDIRAALDALFDAVPAVREAVVWGLCDGATAAAFYAPGDARVCGAVLVNPWTRTEAGEAKAQLKHYYRARLLDAGVWKRIAAGDFDFGSAARSLWSAVGRAYGNPAAVNDADDPQPLPDRLYQALARFDGNVLVILSENDLTAQEFGDLVQQSGKWEDLMKSGHVHCHRLAGANHTFSRRTWRDEAAAATLRWLRGIPAGTAAAPELARTQA
ncbi:hydrolase 1, exosortase A system-associated [Noviherbaspirillum sp.]|uniref:hydrolase 1, exosortase A system-associated n=1 Tax=Noviherbaspirillum sp. TaxID=1926288 RepID=UPI002D43A592|nr:hydrolase 1, exosortase A system-associated [Noviherbaspirillum sp.]HZW21692.1 hydrolase 1, exosortase A system-associated [Noviherbaspirillum sp.]